MLSATRAIYSVPVLGEVINVATIAVAAANCGPCAIGVAAATASLQAGVTSGKFGVAAEAGLIAGAEAGAFYGVGQVTPGANDFGSAAYFANVAGHAAVGCTFATAAGGSCGAGALAAGFGAAAGPIISTTFQNPLGNPGNLIGGTIVSATIGGVGSVLGGGKFENGAVTAAFGYLFNAAPHMLAGTDAHQLLLEYLQSGDNGAQWSGNVGLGGLFGGGRPDLIYDPLGGGSYGLFEIKPAGADAAAAAQLQGYIEESNGRADAGDPSLIFSDGPTIKLSGGWFSENTYTYSAGRFQGTIGYTVDNQSIFERINQLFSARPMGTPLPLPTRLPPVAVPP